MQAADPNGSSQIVLAFSGGSAYTSDTTGICMWYPLLVGDYNMEFLFEFVDGAPAIDKEHAYLIWVSDFEVLPQTPFLLPPSSKGLFTLQLIPTGSATIYFTDVPRLRNWKDLTNRSSWGTPVASFIRKAAIFQSTDGGMSGTLPISAQLVSSKPFTLAGKTFDFKNLIPNGMTCFATGYSGTTRGKDKKNNDEGGEDEAGTCIAIGPGQ
jgi:hypothetical protein